jgi:hypothetical protein
MAPLSYEISHFVVPMNDTGERQVLIGAVHAEPVCQAPRHSYGSTECSLLNTRPAGSSVPMHRDSPFPWRNTGPPTQGHQCHRTHHHLFHAALPLIAGRSAHSCL